MQRLEKLLLQIASESTTIAVQVEAVMFHDNMSLIDGIVVERESSALKCC